MFRRSLVSLASIASLKAMEMGSSCDSGTCEGIAAFSPKEFRDFPIRNIRILSHNTKAYELAFPSDQHVMGMSVASLVMVQGQKADGTGVIARPYTPTSLSDHKGSFELVIKSYPEGNVSSYLDKLKVGDAVQVKGPFPKFKYEANMKRAIGMVAGGTGITPMLQVIREVLRNPEDKTQVTLVFANHAEGDILLKAELDALAAAHDNLRIVYVVSEPTSAWTGIAGRINYELLLKTMPAPAADVAVYVCGPPGFMRDICGEKTPDYKQGLVGGFLKDAGYTEDMVFKF